METSNNLLSKEEDFVKTLACDHDWSQLHQDIIIRFVERVVSMKDLIAFRGVCKSWRSAAIKENSNRALRLDHIVPVLLFSYENDVYSLTKDDTYQLDLPKANGDTRSLSSLGWLLLKERHGSELHLLNPLSHSRINLPHLHPDHRYICKFVLSSSPSWTSSYGVMLQTTWYLLFYSPGYNDDKWTRINLPNGTYFIVDTTYSNGQFYAVNYSGCVFVCDMEDPNDPQLRVVAPNFPMELFGLYQFQLLYIMESAATGGLLLVVFFYVVDHLQCRVFEVPIISKGNSWSSKSEVKNLGKRNLFLSLNSSSFSIEALVNDSICKANCIYFKDPSHRRTAISIYNMEDGKIELRSFEFNGDISKDTWIQPSF